MDPEMFTWSRGVEICNGCGRTVNLMRPDHPFEGWTIVAGDPYRRPVCWECAQRVALSADVLSGGGMMPSAETENWEAFREADAKAHERENSPEELRRQRDRLLKRVAALTRWIEEGENARAR